MALVNDHPLKWKADNTVYSTYGYTAKPSTPCLSVRTGGGTRYFRLGQSKYFTKSITTISGGLKYYIQPGQATVTVTFLVTIIVIGGSLYMGLTYCNKIECDYNGLSEEMSECRLLIILKRGDGTTKTLCDWNKSNGLYLSANATSKDLTLENNNGNPGKPVTVTYTFSFKVFNKTYSKTVTWTAKEDNTGNPMPTSLSVIVTP